MSTQSTNQDRTTGPKEAHYTICPVLTASNVAAEKGWLDEEFQKAGVKLSYLRSLPDNIGWLPHYSHRLDNLFRDGGNIPAIWAKADMQNTKVVGLTFTGNTGEIVVRAKSGIHSVRGLRGRRIGLPRSQNLEKVDWWRGTAERSVLNALDLNGLGPKEVELVDVPDPDRHVDGKFTKPSEVWALRKQAWAFGPEVTALRDGRVDAIYSTHGRSSALVETGEFKVIEDLGNHPDWTLGVANSPWTITVNTEFAEAHPEAVVAYLRAAIRGAVWIKKNLDEAAEVFTKVTFYRKACEVKAALGHTKDLTPNFSAKAVAGLEIQKQFLVEHGYIKNDFDVNDWIDRRYLDEALKSL